MEVLYHIRPYFLGISPYIGLIYGRYLDFRILKWPLRCCWEIKKITNQGNLRFVSSFSCRPIHRCPFPIGWLINRGVWRNPFDNREMMIDVCQTGPSIFTKGHYWTHSFGRNSLHPQRVCHVSSRWLRGNGFF